MRRDAGNLDPAGGEFHDYEHVIRHQTVPCRPLYREEVRGSQHVPVQLEELGPAHARLAALRSELHMVATENITHRDRIDAVPQVRQCFLDAPIAPGSVLLRHLDHELFDLLNVAGPSKWTTLHAPIELLGDEATVPPQERVWGDKGRHV